MHRKNLITIGLGLIGLLGLAYVVLKPSAYRGMEVNPPAPVTPMTLTDSNGQPYQLAGQPGRVTVVFFGYTHCPDECPATMAKLKLAMLELGTQAQNVQVLLVTTDPARDTPQALKEYVAIFNPTFLGLTGTQAQLAPVWDAYGVVVEDNGETHSELMYVIDQSGNLRLTLASDLESGDIAHDLQTLLDGG